VKRICNKSTYSNLNIYRKPKSGGEGQFELQKRMGMLGAATSAGGLAFRQNNLL